MTTPNLQLPEVPEAILTATDELNEGLWTQDAVVQLAVISRSVLFPPSTALQGHRYIIPADALGNWEGRTNHVAYLSPLGWRYYVPRPGWMAAVLDEGPALVVYYENAWTVFIEDDSAGSAGPLTASEVEIDSISGMAAANVQEALEELDGRFDSLEAEDIPIDPISVLDADNVQEALQEICDVAIGNPTGVVVYPWDIPPALGNAMDDEFNDSSFDSVKWTWVNQGTGSVVESASTYGNLELHSGTTTNAVRMLIQAVPSAPWEFLTKQVTIGKQQTFHATGICVRRSAAASVRNLLFGPQFIPNYSLYLQAWQDNAHSANIANITWTLFTPTYLKVAWDGSLITFSYSSFGHPSAFLPIIAAFDPTPYIGGAPDQVGIFSWTSNGTDSLGLFDYFRRTV